MTPQIIHYIFFPWDEHHKLKANENDFDHSPIFNMRRYAPDFDVQLWTYSKARDFCSCLYPSVWNIVQKCPHPTMMVDILRWVIVHHFGGIYWQISTTPLLGMKDLLPSTGKKVRLFTEFHLSPGQCQNMAAEPIRKGEPEEPIRVLNQVFAAEPQTDFIQKHIALILERNVSCVPKNDYDILFIGANAALSTSYDRFGKNDPSVELMSLEKSRCMLKWRYLGSWRKETRVSPPPAIPAPVFPPFRCCADRIPALASAYYLWIKPHPHEQWLDQQDLSGPRTSCLPLLQSIIVKQNIQTVFEAPCGLFQPTDVRCLYMGGDPSRRVIHENRLRATQPHTTFRHVRMLYSRFPEVDLFVCPDFLEWLPFSEAFRLLRRILLSKPRFLALTGYPLLTETWDTAFGDFRPFNPLLPPFQLPESISTIPFPSTPNRRPDKCLFLWKTDSLASLCVSAPQR